MIKTDDFSRGLTERVADTIDRRSLFGKNDKILAAVSGGAGVSVSGGVGVSVSVGAGVSVSAGAACSVGAGVAGAGEGPADAQPESRARAAISAI